MEAATEEHRIEAQEAELATLYGGFEEGVAPFPLLVEPREETWSEESEFDAQIFAGLLRLSP
jgi:hypothetical protein